METPTSDAADRPAALPRRNGGRYRRFLGEHSRPREVVLVLLLLLLTYANFFQAATWGSATRFDLARSLVERGSVRIDEYHGNTGDKAMVDGGYYSDKAPLPSLLGAAGVAGAHALRSVTGRPVSDAVWLTLAGGLAALAASGLVTALGGVAFHLALRDRGLSFRRAWSATFLVFLGTTLLPYATLLQGHAPAAAWLFLFFHVAFPARATPGPGRCAVAGAIASAAFATEYLTPPPLAVLAGISLLSRPGGRLARAAAFALGALPGLLLLGTYHQAAFGSPLDVGYRHEVLPVFQESMGTGLLGVRAPAPRVAAELLFGPYRGLFFASPVLLLAVSGLARLLRDRERRAEAAAAVLIFVYYLVVNAGYSTWHGGWAVGPRHLVPAIPFLGLGVAAELGRRRGAFVLGAVSVVLMLAATSVQPEVPEDIRNPWSEHILPRFARGELSVGEQGFDEPYPARKDPAVPDRWDAFVAGEAIGLHGHLALLPVVTVWLLFSPWMASRIGYLREDSSRTRVP
ncbi:MAG: hypothetical protein ACT4PE_03205 [Candidatus Eiseniibacteriota bacterium]